METTSIDKLIKMAVKDSKAFYRAIAESMTPAERWYIRDLLENRSCETCQNGTCRVETCEKVGLDENGNPQGYRCIGWENYELIGKSKVLQKTNVSELLYL